MSDEPYDQDDEEPDDDANEAITLEVHDSYLGVTTPDQ